MTLAQFQGSMPNSQGAGMQRWGSWEVIGPEGGALVEGVNPISAGRLWEVCQPDSAHPPHEVCLEFGCPSFQNWGERTSAVCGPLSQPV